MSWQLFDENGALLTALASIPDHNHLGTGSGGQITDAALSAAVGVAKGGLGITTTPANGQIPIGNGTNYVAAAITAGEGISVTNGAGSITVAIAPKYAILREEQSSGVAGGASTATTWSIRVLNTEVTDPDNIVALSSNRFTPIAGTYRIRAESNFAANVSASTGARLRLYNNTGASVVTLGVSVVGAASGFMNAFLDTVFTANGTDAFEIDYYVTVAKTVNGLGAPLSITSTNEVYTQVNLEKIG